MNMIRKLFGREPSSSKETTEEVPQWMRQPLHPSTQPLLNPNANRIGDLGQEQADIFRMLENSQDYFFVTGRAGSGKSHLLRHFVKNTKKKTVVVAPTGVAALNAGGETIHSVFSLPPRFIDTHELRESYRPANARRWLLERIDVVVIDEVSMVRADLLDGIDTALRIVRKSEQPFGGVQIISFGDLFQLSPIVDDKHLENYFAHNHGGAFFFNADVWKEAKLNTLQLSTSYRQSDSHFLSLLDGLRDGSVTTLQLQAVNERIVHDPEVPEVATIRLTCTNAQALQINGQRLKGLKGQARTYVAETEGEYIGKSVPT